ncbi:MAG: antibiotic acetyltransferase, partial [bacterium]
MLSGVSIGHGAGIGAGAVVTRDVPPYAIAVGNPARVVRHRFAPDIVARLLATRWWEWPDDRIRDLDAVFYGPVEAFLER